MRVGIVGNGSIVKTMIKNIHDTEGITMTAICVREKSIEAGKVLAQQNDAALFTDYDQFLKYKEIDIIYIGIINEMHYPYAKKALEAGVHVICEKPFTIEPAQLAELIAIAKEKRLFLWESMRVFHSPVTLAVKEHLEEVGELRLMQWNLCQKSGKFLKFLIGQVDAKLNPGKGYGTLYDMNVYNVATTTFLLGKTAEVWSVSNPGWNGTNLSGTVILRYPITPKDPYDVTTALSVCISAKDSDSPDMGFVQGTTGTIYVEGPSMAPTKAFIRRKNEEDVVIATDDNAFSFRHLLKRANEDMQKGDYALCYEYLEKSMELMETMDLAYNNMK